MDKVLFEARWQALLFNQASERARLEKRQTEERARFVRENAAEWEARVTLTPAQRRDLQGQIKPGTRCECRHKVIGGCHAVRRSPDRACQRDAVRLVTVGSKTGMVDRNTGTYGRSASIPMCTSCAAYADKEGAR